MKKKNLLISALLLGASSAMLMGFDSAATVDDVMSKYMEASQNVADVSANATLNAQVGLSMSSESSGTSTLSVGGTGDFSISYKMDPMSFGMSGGLNIGMMGVEQAMEMEMYMVPGEDGTYELYSYMDDGTGGTWEYTVSETDQAEIDQALEAIKAASGEFDFSQLPGTWSLGEEPVDVNGTSCYQLLYTVTYSDLEQLIADSMAATGEEMDEEEAAMMEAVLSGLVFNIEVDVDAETYQAQRMYMDMNGSDLTGISTLISMAMAQSSGDSDGPVTMPEISLDISNLYLEATYDYSTPVEVTVPDEALQAKDGTASDAGQSLGEVTVESVETAE